MGHAAIDFTEKMFQWCVDELRYKVGIYQKTGAISVYDADVVKSDNIVSENIREALKDAVRCLEDIPEVCTKISRINSMAFDGIKFC